MTEFPTINRIAVVLMPTQACLDWISSCSGDTPTTLDDPGEEPTVYLLPEGRGEPDEVVRRHYQVMFEQELGSWYTDSDLWPRDRSFRMFNHFFTVHVSTMVFDLGNGMIVRDED